MSAIISEPGKYLVVEWEDDPRWEAVTGHIPRDQFLDILSAHTGWPKDDDSTPLEHAWMAVESAPDECDWDEEYVFCDKDDEGSFPVSVFVCGISNFMIKEDAYVSSIISKIMDGGVLERGRLYHREIQTRCEKQGRGNHDR